MEVKLHATINSLLIGGDYLAPVPTNQGSGWTPERLLALCRRENLKTTAAARYRNQMIRAAETSKLWLPYTFINLI
jgi:hypothetical protein